MTLTGETGKVHEWRWKGRSGRVGKVCREESVEGRRVASEDSLDGGMSCGEEGVGERSDVAWGRGGYRIGEGCDVG